ncbi:MAG: hypothetical protein M3R50_10305 [Bacteroidota bacterium]|nr:hypothetical protein [Bacteroidota bacterium]
MSSKSSATRFSDRVDDYVKYRHGYSMQAIETLKDKSILNKSSIIADIGSGTGISSKMIIINGNKVYGVEA